MFTCIITTSEKRNVPALCSFLLIALLFVSSCHSRRHIQHSQASHNSIQKVYNVSTSLQKEIDTWMNVPYQYGGNDHKGVDCSGLTCAIYKKVFQTNLPRTSKQQFAQSKKISEKELQEGDLVFFRINTKEINHVGLYLSNQTFIHSSASKGVMLSRLDEAYFKKYFAGAGRFRH